MTSSLTSSLVLTDGVGVVRTEEGVSVDVALGGIREGVVDVMGVATCGVWVPCMM